MVSDRSNALRWAGRPVEATTPPAGGSRLTLKSIGADGHPCEGAVWRWEDPDAGRYYEARMVRDLVGDWQVMRVWGGVGSDRGAMRFDPLAEPGAFAGELARIDKRRVQRGYFPRP